MVDEDQQGRALAVICRNPPGLKDEFVYQINAYAGKAHRENFIEYIHSQYPEFFDDNEDLDLITQAVNATASGDIKKYLEDMCGDYEKPCLEFEINAAEIV